MDQREFKEPMALAEGRVDEAAAEAFEKAGAFRDAYIARRPWKVVDRRAAELKAALEKLHRERRVMEEIGMANAPTSDHLRDR
jgi:predicted metalloprotease